MKGQTAIITGSSRGIGRTTAEEFAKKRSKCCNCGYKF